MKAISVLILLLASSLCSGPAPQQAASEAPWKITIAPEGEPGEPLIVSGTVYAEDVATPLAGVSVYVYHTDARGHYSLKDARDSENPRLRGLMRTDAQGRYEYRTVKPGSYPGTRNPAHIHYVVSATGYREKQFEIIFEGDPFITDRIRSEAERGESGYSLRRHERDDKGVLRCVQDIKLRRD
jgi:protocatechuate 3,4-dioxygenase beta subunit